MFSSDKQKCPFVLLKYFPQIGATELNSPKNILYNEAQPRGLTAIGAPRKSVPNELFLNVIRNAARTDI